MQADAVGRSAAWSFAVRDDQAVARALGAGEPINGIHNLEEAAALDEILLYLDQSGFLSEIERLASRMRVERVNVPPLRYLMLYIVKILLGIEGIARMAPVLLRDEAMMRRLGFNGHEVEHGTTRRGDHARGPDTEREGPVSSEAVAQNMVKFSVLALASFFNALAVRATKCVISEDAVDGVVDCTDFETTDKFSGAGKVRRDRAVRVKGSRKPEKVSVVVYGWKVAVLYHARLGLPLSVCVAPIQRSDHDLFWNVVDDADKNLRACGKRLGTVTMDKGFLDGADLWQLQERGIGFVVPAKKDMDVYQDAIALASAEEFADGVIKQEWTDEVVTGRGRERKVVTVPTEVVGVPNLTTMATYGPAENAKKQHNKDFTANPINAVVVATWRGRTFTKPVVFLTNQSIKQPRKIFEQYDDRSLIENGLFREGKQAWSLQRPPQKSEAGVMTHVYLTLGTMLMTRCYRLELEREERKMKRSRAKEGPRTPLLTGMERYRLELKLQNKDKVIVFKDDLYAIMYVQEMAMLSGVRLCGPQPRGIGTYEETLQKFRLTPEISSG